MNTKCGFVYTAAVIAVLATAVCAAPQPVPEWDGLELRPAEGFDAFYLWPGVDFKAYKTLTIDPVEVAFDKNWDPNQATRDLSRRLTPDDIQELQDDMASEFRKILSEELAKGGYTVVE